MDAVTLVSSMLARQQTEMQHISIALGEAFSSLVPPATGPFSQNYMSTSTLAPTTPCTVWEHHHTPLTENWSPAKTLVTL